MMLDFEDQTLHLGSSIDAASSDYFQGLIDDVRIYDRALSEEEIGQLYGM